VSTKGERQTGVEITDAQMSRSPVWIVGSMERRKLSISAGMGRGTRDGRTWMTETSSWGVGAMGLALTESGLGCLRTR
jgi:hypothetical protein